MARQSYTIIYAPEVAYHVRAVERKYHRLIRDTIKKQLSHTPDRSSRNRKPLERIPGPSGSTWELRFGPANRFRAFYEFDEVRRTVSILALGVKDGQRLYIAGKELEL